MRRATRVPAASAFGAHGDGSMVLGPARVEGAGHMRLGCRVLIHELSWLIAHPAPDGTAPRLEIGDDSSFLRFLKLVCTGEVTIGPGLLGGEHVYISDTEYRHDVPGTPIALQGLAPPRPVRIGEGVHLGFAAKILPGVTIGDFAYVAAGAVVTEDVPTGAVVVGNPARVLRT